MKSYSVEPRNDQCLNSKVVHETKFSLEISYIVHV